MAWEIGKQKVKQFADFNSIVKELTGYLSEKEAKLALIQFLKTNIGYTFQMLSGFEMEPYQEIILKACFLKDNGLIVAGRGCAKCLDENSIILTHKGFIKLKEANVGDQVFAQKETNQILAKTNNGCVDGLKLCTNDGYTIIGKKEHKCLVFVPDLLEFKYVELQNLNKNKQYIPIRANMNIWGNNKILENIDCSIHDPREKPIQVTDTEDFFYFMGLLLGGGCTRKSNKYSNAISITSNDQQILDFSQKFLQSIAPNNKQKTTAKAVRIASGPIMRLLYQIGFSNQSYAHQKTIPNKILLCSKDRIKAFLQGLFDTDGYASLQQNPQKNAQLIKIGLTSTSFEIIKTVQTILLNFNIFSSVCVYHNGGKYKINGVDCNTRKTYSLVITGYENVFNFHTNIGFRLTRKQNLVEKYITEFKKENDYCNQLVPIGQYFQKKYKQKSFTGRDGHCWKVHRGISFDRIRWLLDQDFIDDIDKDKLRTILNSNCGFRKIKSIKKCQTKTIDIQVDKEECYWSDGLINHNSTLISIYSLLCPIFRPNAKVCLISANFRSSRRILEAAEKMVKGPKAGLLLQCFPYNMQRTPDMFRWKLDNGSEVFALPLSNGDGLRGTRASDVLVDEGLMISEEIQDVIIRPFLTAKQNFQEEKEIRQAEDALIRAEKITEADRISFPRNKYLVFSSASYQFDYLYKMFCNWIDLINTPSKESDPPTYFVMRMSYEAIPENSFLDMTQINAAKQNGGEFTEYFKREYKAIFSDSSNSYFNPKKMQECTVKNGDEPTVQIKGHKDSKYILAIDPAYGGKSSDYFAMSVHLLIPEERRTIQVHTYGKAGSSGSVKDHYEYLVYLLTYFNIVFIIMDNSGSEFIHGYNESAIANERGLKLNFMKADFEADDYLEELRKAVIEYNLTNRTILYGQNFTSNSVRKMNEHLQNQIDARKVWFASKICTNETAYKKACEVELPFVFKNKNDKDFARQEYLEDQDRWIDATKEQTALIEVSVTALGTQQFNLPRSLRQSTAEDRKRKDHYTCLLLASYGAKIYFDLMYVPKEESVDTFSPIIIK